MRDLLGNRIRKTLTGFQQSYMEKFYIYNNKIYQIIRIDRHYRLDGGFYYDILSRDINSLKIRYNEINHKAFEDRKFYHTKAKAKNDIE